MFDSIRAMMREPLLHFLIGGLGLFLLFDLVSESTRSSDDEIFVSAGQIAHMQAIFRKTRQRPPSADEIRGLIDNFIVEEVLYREALSIGLDKDDTIIRRRLRQKMEFLLDDFTIVEPSDADLQQYLTNNPDRFRKDGLISFSQIYLNEYSGDKAVELLSGLQVGEIKNPSERSESYLLPYHIEEASESVVSAQFGEKFMLQLFALDVGSWLGPVDSPFGIHLILIDKIVEGRIPELEEIRQRVAQEWLVDFREKAQQGILEQMRAQYSITIDMPGDEQ